MTLEVAVPISQVGASGYWPSDIDLGTTTSFGSMDHLLAPPSTPRTVPLALPPHNPGETSSWILKSMKWRKSPALRPCYAVLDTSSGWRIIVHLIFYCTARSPLSIAADRHQRNDSRIVWKKSFGACQIDHSTLDENCGACCLTINHSACSFENTCRAALREKKQRRKYG